MNNYYLHTLPNGLRIVHKPVVGSVAYCGFFVNGGTRDELPEEFGMAHFVEHMLFKGTKKRKSHHVINRMENVGGELNAYTNKEETVIYSVFLEQHIGRAMELLSDLVFNSTYPQVEIEKEREVIIDEISSYEDSPSDLIFDKFENLVFAGSGLEHDILGTPDTLKTFDASKAKQFTGRYYQPENMVFFSMGKTNFKKIVYYAEKYFSGIESSLIDPVERKIPIINQPKIITEQRETSQVHALIGGRSLSIYDDRRKALNLLNNILGGPGMNSRLNISLREKHGYVYNVESSTTIYSDTGLFTVYFGCDKRNKSKCISLVQKELKRLRDEKISTSRLAAFKKQFKGQIGVSNENRESIALSLGKSIFYYNHFHSLEELFAKIDSVTSEQILDVANQIFDENQMFQLIFE